MHGSDFETDQTMQNQNEIKTEYLDLINKLNSSNRVKNEKTEIQFLTKTLPDGTVLLVATANCEKYLSFGKLENRTHLKIDRDFEFQHLAKYIKISINNCANLQLAIRLAIDRLFSV